MRGGVDALDYLNHVDSALFVQAGRNLLSSEWGMTFAHPATQAGPLQILLYGIAAMVADLPDVTFKIPLAAMVEAGYTIALMLATRLLLRLSSGEDLPQLEALAGITAIAGGLSWQTYTSAHPAEGAIAILWVVAGVAATKQNPYAGLVLGLSSGFKLWGLLGVPVILLLDRGRDRAAAVSMVALTCAVLYLPFLLFGEFRSFEYRWDVAPDAPLRLALGADTPFTWPMRLVQAVVVVGTGAWMALRFRRSRDIAWALPLWVVGVRLLIDPLDYHYYWVAAWTICTLGILTRIPRRPSLTWLALAASFYPFMIGFDVVYGLVEAWVWVALCVWLLVFTYRYLQRGHPRGDPPEPRLARRSSDLAEQTVHERA